MHWYRITKYNPALRDHGVYTRDEWTSICDVGKSYYGVPFSMDEYLEVENNYITCVKSIMRYIGITAFAISELEVYSSDMNVENGETISGKRVDRTIRACLREEIWCVLLSKNMKVQFGYDYYMYIMCDMTESEAAKIATGCSLYAERIPDTFFVDD